MKISKIFHWLYASVMLMPIFAIGVKCGYVMLNKNAKESYSGDNETIYNVINNSDDLYNNLNRKYIFSPTRNNVSFNETNNIQITLYITNIDNISHSFVTNNDLYETNRIVLTLSSTYSPLGVRCLLYNSDILLVDFLSTQSSFYCECYISNVYTSSNFVNFLQYNTPIKYVDNENYLDNVFYYAVDQINNEPLFSWAQSSFLSQPLLFITNFFGVPSTSPILTILCYWFSISVIWLVFDAVMYFPLLIHRWLDKGVLE